MRALKAGVVYFLLVFAVGWVLGPIRELWAVPQFGRMAAMLSEAVILLIAMTVTARWVVRRFEVPRTLFDTLSIGLIAIGLLFPAEIAGVVWVRGLSFQEYVASFVTGLGVISLVMFLVFGAMPTLVTRAGSVSRPNDTAEAEDLWETDHRDSRHPYRFKVRRDIAGSNSRSSGSIGSRGCQCPLDVGSGSGQALRSGRVLHSFLHCLCTASEEVRGAIGLGHSVDLRSTGRSLTGRANAATVAPVFIW
jgi:hypothetical protein